MVLEAELYTSTVTYCYRKIPLISALIIAIMRNSHSDTTDQGRMLKRTA
jgi:hypothetical protein